MTNRATISIRLAALIVAALRIASLDGHALAKGEDAAALKRGAALVRQNCGTCHAIGRSDMSKHKDAPPFRTLGKRYPIDSLQEALVEGLISGHPDMPEFRFSPPDANAVIVYLESIQQK